MNWELGIGYFVGGKIADLKKPQRRRERGENRLKRDFL
jgi:hypothetical protein